MVTSTRSGDVLAGRYQLIDLLSESGGGRFWRAHDSVLERYVALHVIAVDDPRAPLLIEAARTSAGVLDSRILRVLDAEEEDDRCFVVNEWGTGTSLDILVTHSGPLTPRRAAWLVADVAGAIAAAHAAGVTHGRLNPENVLIDRYGAVRLIGMCVDAALHGLPPAEPQADLEDLGGLLHCALTATWPGPSGSIVPAAPRESGHFLSPRQVQAGVPTQLDQVWREFDCKAKHGRRRRLGSEHPDVSSAQGIAHELLEFVGDPAGMPASLARAIPPVNELRPVWLPALADPLPHDSSADDIPVVRPLAETGQADQPEQSEQPGPGDTAERPASGAHSAEEQPGEGPTPSATEQPTAPRTELPTEAGMPVFDGDDVQWLRTRSTPPPPPPPFEDPPERPLFAEGPGTRRPPPELGPPPLSGAGPLDPGDPAEFWPWERDPAGPPGEDDDEMPGRNWMRLAMGVAIAILLLVAIVVAFNLGRGRDVLGGRDDDATATPSTTAPGPVRVLKGVTGTAFDPLGTDGGAENSDSVAQAFDGDPTTTWSTQTYIDQLGPSAPSLKAGVGLLVDLGKVRSVASVTVHLGDGKSRVALYPSDRAPTAAPKGDPVAQASGSGSLTLVPAGQGGAPQPVRARYLVLWWTALPQVSDGFRAEVSEVVVRGE